MARSRYQLVEIGHYVLFPVEAALMDELRSAASDIQIGG